MTVTVPYALENLDSNPAAWPFQYALLTVQGTVSGSSFSYTDSCEAFDSPFQPPLYLIKYSACFTVPKIASSLMFIATLNSGQSGTPPITWDLATEIGSSSQAQVHFPSSNTDGLIQLGKPITQQGVMDITLSQVELHRDCSNNAGVGTWWSLSFKLQLHNNYGQNVSGPRGGDITVFNDQGGGYKPRPGEIGNDELSSVPPGETHTANKGITVTLFKMDGGALDGCQHPNDLNRWFPAPKGMRLLIILQAVDQVGQVWGVYDLGNPPQAPGING